MPELYSPLKVAELLSRDLNEILSVLRKEKIQLEEGSIPESSLGIIKKALGVKEKEGPKKKPEEKPSRRYNPSAIHTFYDSEEGDAFIKLVEEEGGDMSEFPNYVFGGLVFILQNQIIEKHFEGSSLEEVVRDFYPLEIKDTEGNIRPIQDNIWLVKGAVKYKSFDDKTKKRIIDLAESHIDDLEFVFALGDLDSDVFIASAIFQMTIDGKKTKFFNPTILERFKWLSNGLLLYKNIDKELKQILYNAFEESYRRPIEFSYWLFDKNIFSKMQEKVNKKIRDDNSYITAVLFGIKEKDLLFKLNLGLHQSFERYYSSFRRMEEFKRKGNSFYIALNRIKNDIKTSRKNDKKIDVDLFIAKTIQNGTYKFFYDNYCGRGIQYATFVNYAAAALLLESREDSQNKIYAEQLSKISKERGVEKVDRLRGKIGKTILVELCEKYRDYDEAPKLVYDDLTKNWEKYKDILHKQGCWVKSPRKDPFSLKEVKEMYELVNRFSNLFNKINK